MREIKFRGKRADGKWVYGYLVKDDCEYLIGADVDSMFDVVPETIGQYTGLSDFDVTAIYEGDILGEPHHGEAVTVEWKDDGFIAKFENGDEVALANIARYCRIEGNIYDNPELVEGE